MGCCYSSETKPGDQHEVTKPLIPPSNPCSPPDEQDHLSSILKKTALNIIDVSSSGCHGMEQHEYMDKTRQYSTKLALVGDGLSQKKPAALPSLTSQPHKVLASDLISHHDVQQVSKIAAYAHSAISQIRVDTKEDLVVQFAIP